MKRVLSSVFCQLTNIASGSAEGHLREKKTRSQTEGLGLLRRGHQECWQTRGHQRLPSAGSCIQPWSTRAPGGVARLWSSGNLLPWELCPTTATLEGTCGGLHLPFHILGLLGRRKACLSVMRHLQGATQRDSSKSWWQGAFFKASRVHNRAFCLSLICTHFS